MEGLRDFSTGVFPKLLRTCQAFCCKMCKILQSLRQFWGNGLVFFRNATCIWKDYRFIFRLMAILLTWQKVTTLPREGFFSFQISPGKWMEEIEVVRNFKIWALDGRIPSDVAFAKTVKTEWMCWVIIWRVKVQGCFKFKGQMFQHCMMKTFSRRPLNFWREAKEYNHRFIF